MRLGRIGFWYRLAVLLLKPPLLVLTRRDWRGLEHVPADGGVLIPQRDSVYMAIVGSEQTFDEHYSAWRSDMHGWRLAPARRLLANSIRKVNLSAADLLTPPALWVTLDYRTVTSVDYRASVQWTIERAGTGHGLAVWFESELCDGVYLSNRPGAQRLIYGQAFFPWPQPVSLAAADSVLVTLRCHLMNAADDYIWSWNSRVDRSLDRSQGPLVFEQSTFHGRLLAAGQLPRLRLDAAPVLLPHGQAARIALALMDGQTPMHEIASKLTAEFPGQFPRVAQAIKFVSSLYERFWR